MEPLIINGINFDHILNMEKVVLHTRIEEIWLQQEEHDYHKWRMKMFKETGMIFTMPNKFCLQFTT